MEEQEFRMLQQVLPAVWDDLSAEAQRVIEKQGVSYIDSDGDPVTSIVGDQDCVFTCYDAQGRCQCAIEKAYLEKRIDWIKPISCHLYPIRIDRHPTFDAVNYHRWRICHAAEAFGSQNNLRVYQFLKEPLIRKYGSEWYETLDQCAQEYLNPSDT